MPYDEKIIFIFSLRVPRKTSRNERWFGKKKCLERIESEEKQWISCLTGSIFEKNTPFFRNPRAPSAQRFSYRTKNLEITTSEA